MGIGDWGFGGWGVWVGGGGPAPQHTNHTPQPPKKKIINKYRNFFL